MIKDAVLVRALSKCEELSDFLDDEYDTSNQEFLSVLANVKKLLIFDLKNPINDNTVRELRTLLPYMTSLELLSMNSRGNQRADVSNVIKELGESIKTISLENVDVSENISISKEQCPNIGLFSISKSNISQIPDIGNEGCLITLGDKLPNIPPRECFLKVINGKNINAIGDPEIASVIWAYRGGNSVPLEVYEKYMDLFSQFGDKDIVISIPNVSKIDIAKLEELRKNPHIKYIDIKSGCFEKLSGEGEEYYYSLDQYAQIRKKIDEIVAMVKVPDNNDSDREKKIFAQIYFILGNTIDYDHYAISEEGSKDRQLVINCRNLKNCFLGVERNGKTEFTGVCAAKADALKNVSSCFGIDCGYISSLSEPDLVLQGGAYVEKRNEQGKIIYQNGTDDPMGHAYNCVVLDGKKYFCDLTWDSPYIRQHRMPLPYFLNGFDDFYESHKDVGFKDKTEYRDAKENYPTEEQPKLLENTDFYKYYSTMLHTKELNKLLGQNYLCGFLQEYVDVVRGGRQSITINELQQIFALVGQIEDRIISHRGGTDLGIRIGEGEKARQIIVPTSNPKKLEEMRKAINERRSGDER